LATAYRQARGDLTPVAADAFAVVLQPLLDFAVTFGKARFSGEGHRQAVIAEYRESLGHLPADLLERAISAHKRAWVYPQMPTPAELLAHVDGEMSKRRVALGRIEMAGKRVVDPVTAPTVKVNVAGLLERLREIPDGFGAQR